MRQKSTNNKKGGLDSSIDEALTSHFGGGRRPVALSRYVHGVVSLREAIEIAVGEKPGQKHEMPLHIEAMCDAMAAMYEALYQIANNVTIKHEGDHLIISEGLEGLSGAKQ